MEIDASPVTSEAAIVAQICIIGGGPAGLVLAAELSRRGRDVLLLESGTVATDASVVRERAQELNEGNCVGDLYAGLSATRFRGVGGATSLWNSPTPRGAGAKYVPLDPWDFEPRWPDASAGWPFSFDQLRPYYERAQSTCGLGRFSYEPANLHSPDVSPIAIGDGVESRLYHMGARASLIDPLLDALRHSPNARMITGATVTTLRTQATHTTVRVASGESTFDVHANRVVLAGGAIENARLLLVASEQGGVPQDRSGWLGRGFMEHPRDRSITLHPETLAQYRALGFYDAHVQTNENNQSDTTVLGRFALNGETIRKENLLNASATLLPNVRLRRDRIREVMVRRTGYRGLTRWLPESGHGWSRHSAPQRVFSGFTVLLNLEQPPRRENAITLSQKCDRFGVPLPELHWRWHADDQARLQRVRSIFANALERVGAGRVTVSGYSHPDPNGHHHAGTTRMHRDPTQGVVDADGLLFGTESVFVVGASTFPTSGFANPTLTIVAMALRLADRLHNDV